MEWVEKMDAESLSNRVAKHAIQRNILAIIASLSLISTVVLSFKVLFQDVEVRIVPGLGGDAMSISRSKVNHTYMEMVTRDITTSWANSVSSSEKYVRDIMMGYVCPQFEGNMSQNIFDRWEDIRRKKIQTVFHPKSIKTHPEELVASIKGRLDTWIGKLRTSSEEIEFRITYELKSGRICFSNFVGIKK